ncbi:MAG: hypothetical protein AAF652_11540, partial [Cyanobacteria bacterium P01_C01_bin.72]
MESSKVVNKILLISLAFGSATIVVGMLLAKGNFKKALLGVGATASVGSVAGFLINSQSQKHNSISEEIELNEAQVVEVGYQESQAEQFANEESKSIKVEETDSDSLTTESEQPLNQNFELDTAKPSPEIESEVSILEVQTETEQDEILEQTVAPLEENIVEIEVKVESSTEIPLESEAFSDELVDSQSFIDTPEEAKEIIDTDINPFASSSDLSESSQNENIPDLETVDKMFGAFDQEELEAFKNQPLSEIENVSGEEADELLMEDEFSVTYNSSLVDVAEIDDKSEEAEELVSDDESEESDGFDFNEDSAISTELEAPSEAFSLNSDSEMDSEYIDELPVMEMDSEDEFEFNEESAIATESEAPSGVFSLDSDLESESIDELPVMEMESEDEFEFGAESESSDEH